MIPRANDKVFGRASKFYMRKELGVFVTTLTVFVVVTIIEPRFLIYDNIKSILLYIPSSCCRDGRDDGHHYGEYRSLSWVDSGILGILLVSSSSATTSSRCSRLCPWDATGIALGLVNGILYRS
jgi:hypothetical protein